jgi:hypothetical protein
MQLNAYPHDLDPYFSGGSATATNGGVVTVGVVSDNSANTNTGANDPNAWTVSYTGPGFLKTLSFNPEATGATGGNPTGGNFTGFTPTDFLDPTKYAYTPGMVFNVNQFTYGTLGDLTSADVTTSFTNAAPLPSTNAFFWTLNLSFGANKLTAGKSFRFDVGRNQQQDATTPQGMTIPNPVFGQPNEYSADILGDGVLIPEYGDTRSILLGMTFSGTVSDGATDYPFNGRIRNKIGHGYSRLDGFGFVNAEAATAATVPVPGVVSRKVHGVVGTFDVPLPFNGTAGIECRAPGPNDSYELVYTFDRPVSTAGTVAVQGTGTVATAAPGSTNPSVGPMPNQITVDLTGVANAQHLIATLSNVQDTSGATLNAVAARMDVLVGDTTASGAVNAGDAAQTQSESGHPVTSSNFREDVTANGSINSSDIALVQSKSGTALP